MSEPSGYVLGFDPGGEGKFGWCACLTEGGGLELVAAGLVDNALEAICQTDAAIDSRGTRESSRIVAAGIDAPMFWSPNGFRTVDKIVSSELKATNFPKSKRGGTVQQLNSLRGACLVQGVLLAKHLRDKWALDITESHPKVLDHLLSQPMYLPMKKVVDDLAQDFHDPERDIRDSVLSAAAAWAMVRRLPGWRNLYCQEPNPLQPFGTPVSYWMPIP